MMAMPLTCTIWMVVYLSKANHEGKCDFRILPCPSCKELLRANELERHNERECPERTLNCKYCKEPFHFKNIKVTLLFSYNIKNQNHFIWLNVHVMWGSLLSPLFIHGFHFLVLYFCDTAKEHVFFRPMMRYALNTQWFVKAVPRKKFPERK